MEEQKAERTRQNGFAFDTSGVLEKYGAKLGYELTNAQKRVICEIAADMERPIPMNRLLQGDVREKGVLIPTFPEIYVPVLDELEGLGYGFEECCAD